MIRTLFGEQPLTHHEGQRRPRSDKKRRKVLQRRVLHEYRREQPRISQRKAHGGMVGGIALALGREVEAPQPEREQNADVANRPCGLAAAHTAERKRRHGCDMKQTPSRRGAQNQVDSEPDAVCVERARDLPQHGTLPDALPMMPPYLPHPLPWVKTAKFTHAM